MQIFTHNLFGCGYEDVRKALFISNGVNKDLATEGKFADMVAPTLFGGHKVAGIGFLGERTRMPREKNLIIGDILYLQDSPNAYSYMYAGNGTFIDLHTGEEVASYGCLEVAIGWEEFVIFRPSLVFEN